MNRGEAVALLLPLAVASLIAAGSPTAPARMPPACTKLSLEMKFSGRMWVRRHPSADIVHGHIVVTVGPRLPDGQACAPTAFHLRLALQFHRSVGWKTVAVAPKDEGILSVGSVFTLPVSRTCEAGWNGRRLWRVRLRWWGRNGLNGFQRGPTRFFPGQAGRELRCLSA